MKKIIFVLCSITCLVACQTQNTDTRDTAHAANTTPADSNTVAQTDKGTLNALGLNGEGITLQREAIALHDKVMAETGKINQLRQKAEQLLKENPKQKELQNLIDSLKNADKAMIDWMRSFKIPRNPEDSIAYLKERKNSMDRIANQTKHALELAKQQLPQ
ncbi:MAG: hypothetical protein JNM36_10895 [Chitinophagales bacterium]|jgi:hypothetical protein|nr:hypothetical protein [Chitinophagales bacterium]HNL08023.1 hypothetical protein [Chitinophagales bacterium]